MTKSIQSRLDTLETVLPPNHRPPAGCTMAEFCQHVAALPPRQQAMCIKSMTDEELQEAIETLHGAIAAGEANNTQEDHRANN